VGKFIVRRLRSGAISEGEDVLIEGKVIGDIYMFCGDVIAAIAFVVCGITNEYARKGSWGEFVRSASREIGKTKIAINPKMIIGGGGVVEYFVRGG
jgi:hypothetical protein